MVYKDFLFYVKTLRYTYNRQDVDCMIVQVKQLENNLIYVQWNRLLYYNCMILLFFMIFFFKILCKDSTLITSKDFLS